MRTQAIGVEVLPPQFGAVDPAHGPVRIVVGVHEDVCLGLEIIPAPSDESNVLCGNHIQVGATGGVRPQRLLSPELEPVTELRPVFQGVEQHLLVVAHQRDQLASTRESDQLLHGALAVRSAVDEIAEDDDDVVGPRIDQLDQRVESC